MATAFTGSPYVVVAEGVGRIMLRYGHGSGGVHMTHFSSNMVYRHYSVNVSFSKNVPLEQQLAILKRKLATSKKNYSEYRIKRNSSRLPCDFYFWDNKIRDERNNIAKIESKIAKLERKKERKNLPQEKPAKNNSCKKRKQQVLQYKTINQNGNKKAPPAIQYDKYPRTNKADLPKKVQAMWDAIQTMCPYATIVAYGTWLFITGTTGDDWPGLKALGCRYDKKRKCVFYAPRK